MELETGCRMLPVLMAAVVLMSVSMGTKSAEAQSSIGNREFIFFFDSFLLCLAL